MPRGIFKKVAWVQSWTNNDMLIRNLQQHRNVKRCQLFHWIHYLANRSVHSAAS